MSGSHIDRNLALGARAGKNLTSGSDNIDIANPGVAGEAGTIRIGENDEQTAAYIAGISGTTLGGAAKPVIVNSNGKLGVAPAASTSLAATVRDLTAELERQQRQIERLRERGKGG